MKRILLSGYYGFDNAGDEAVLVGIHSALRRVIDRSELKIGVLSIDPKATTELHKVAAYHRYRNFIGPILRCKLVLSGGGSLLQDVTSAHGIFYYLAIVRIAQILGKKTMFIAQGIGPLMRQRSRNLTASVANRVDAITVRDTESAELLRTIGVTREITVTADPALLFNPNVGRDVRGVLLSMRPWGIGNNVSKTIADAIAGSTIPRLIDPLNMYGDLDDIAATNVLNLVDNVQRRWRKLTPTDPFYKFGIVGSSEMVIGMRLHALIFAAANGVPCVALSYDPKIDAFMDQVGQSDAVFNIKFGTAQELTSIIDNVWQNKNARRIDILSKVEKLRVLAQQNADIAASLLE